MDDKKVIYTVNFTVTQVATGAGGTAVSAATFNYFDINNVPLAMSQFGASATTGVKIKFGETQDYTSISYVFQPNGSSAGVSFASASTNGGTPVTPTNNAVVIDCPRGTTQSTVLNMSYTAPGSSTALQFSSPDPVEQNTGR